MTLPVNHPKNARKSRIVQIRLLAAKALGFACLLVLFALISLTCIDVVARYFFNAPVSGAYELTEILLATLIFLALPLTTAAGEHIEVELMDGLKSRVLKRAGTIFAGVVTAAVLAVVAFELIDHADKLRSRGQVTDSLDIPLFSIAWLGAISFAASAAAAALWAWRRYRKET